MKSFSCVTVKMFNCLIQTETGKESKVGVILAHRQGLDPDSQVVGPLRKSINQELGFHTLSLQMPVLSGAKSPDKFFTKPSSSAPHELGDQKPG